MRILIAPDKFKGTLTARQAAEAIALGWRKTRPDDTLTLLPISDGGDGFGSVLGEALGAKPQRISTVDAAHRKCVAKWWWQPETHTAIIESANVIGLAMLPRGKFHPFQLDTFGLGKVLHAAAKKGAKKIILGIGGSATNDGGFGLARALGWEFLDARGERIEQWTQLHALAEIRRPKSLKLPKIIVAVDVENPLLGKRGATRVYGPQKGLRAEDFAIAEKNLRRLAMVAKQQVEVGSKFVVAAVCDRRFAKTQEERRSQTAATGQSRFLKPLLGFDFTYAQGAGAAGGLGYGLATFARGELRPGFELLAKTTRLASYLDGCDLVITGEGSLDASSLMGKGAGALAQLCRARKIPVIGLSGVLQDSPKLRKLFAHACSLTQITTPDQARSRAAHWLEILAKQTAGAVTNV